MYYAIYNYTNKHKMKKHEFLFAFGIFYSRGESSEGFSSAFVNEVKRRCKVIILTIKG